jgi:hypothetical protein
MSKILTYKIKQTLKKNTFHLHLISTLQYIHIIFTLPSLLEIYLKSGNDVKYIPPHPLMSKHPRKWNIRYALRSFYTENLESQIRNYN